MSRNLREAESLLKELLAPLRAQALEGIRGNDDRTSAGEEWDSKVEHLLWLITQVAGEEGRAVVR